MHPRAGGLPPKLSQVLTSLSDQDRKPSLAPSVAANACRNSPNAAKLSSTPGTSLNPSGISVAEAEAAASPLPNRLVALLRSLAGLRRRYLRNYPLGRVLPAAHTLTCPAGKATCISA